MRFFVALCAMLIALPAAAGWQLNTEASSLSFVTVKNAKIAEVHSFEQLSGDITREGKVNFDVSLASVNTAIPIRDERMQKFLFNIEKYATASFSADVDMRFIEALPSGQIKQIPLAGKIYLHGQTQTIATRVQLIKLAKNRIAVNAIEPIVFNAEQYDLAAGVEKLREIAGLSTISPLVPVTFTLVFDYQ